MKMMKKMMKSYDEDEEDIGVCPDRCSMCITNTTRDMCNQQPCPGGGDGAKTPARSLSMTTGTLYSPRAAAVGPHVSGGSGGKSQKGNRNEKTSHDG